MATTRATTGATSRGDELTRLLATGGLRVLFQPVVDLDRRTPVAFAALVRGPEDSPLRTPHDLFGAAAAAGRLDDLDRACRRAASAEASAAGLARPWTLFLDHQPEAALGDAVPV
ncbi:EAL domain-containing protein, partial [Kineococcus sp. R8]|nr:EAL domain-containing protein [Kineococcus siccus]